LRVEAWAPDPAALEEAVRLIEGGRVVAVPTDTLYGLAADPFQADAVERVFAIKGRSVGRALPLIAADEAQVVSRLGALPPAGERLARRFWPGPLTLLIAAPPALPDPVAGGTGRVGVRVPAHPVARALCRACDRPLTATSANLSGQPASADPLEVMLMLGDRIDLVLDAGRTPGGQPSTIVDVSEPPLRLIRQGAIRWEHILECMQLAQ
jgi:L-threonylcarbamoyladenylate synthase